MAMQRTTATATKTIATKMGTTSRVRTTVAVLNCEGELGAMELSNICKQIDTLAYRGVYDMVLNLSKATHIDYRGICNLVRKTHCLRVYGGDLKLAGMSRYVSMIFWAVGCEGVFETYDCLDDAKKAFLTSAYCLRH